MIFRYSRLFFQMAFAASILLGTQSVQAQERLALVLESQSDHDSETLKATLNDAGYSVINPGVANRDGVAWAVDVFARKLGRSGPDTVGIIYARLPGASAAGESYLLPSTAVFDEGGDVAADGYSIRDLLGVLSRLNSNNIGLVLDLCHSKDEDGVETEFTAPVPDTPHVLIADCRSRDAVQDVTMSSRFIQAMTTPGLTLRQVFEQTDRGGPGPVIAQEPAANLQNKASQNQSEQDQAEQNQANPNNALDSDTSLEGIVWNAVRSSADESVISEYLERFPDSQYVDDARARLAELRAPPAAAEASTPAQPPAEPSTDPTLGQQLAALQAKKPQPRDGAIGGQTATHRNRFTATLAGTDATGWGNLYRHDCGAVVGYRMTLQQDGDTWQAELVRIADGMTMRFSQRDRVRDDGIVLLHAHAEGAKVTLKVRPGRSEKATYAIPTAGIGSCAVGYLY
jgi:hypothetical protein